MLFLLFLVIVIIVFYKRKDYRESEYFKSKQVAYADVINDKGALGEYRIYNELKAYEKLGARFLFNCYVPKENGDYGEIDVIMVYKTGIYVFESKNYSGWIYGSAGQTYWTQTFKNGQKERFYNPVKQNKSHLNILREYLPDADCVFHSIVVFSNYCTFKKIDTGRENVDLIHLNQVKDRVQFIDGKMKPFISNEGIDRIYNKLYPLTQNTDYKKIVHINNIRNKLY